MSAFRFGGERAMECGDRFALTRNIPVRSAQLIDGYTYLR